MVLIDFLIQAAEESGIDGYVLPDHGIFIETEDLRLDRAITLKEVYLGVPFVWDSQGEQIILDNWSYTLDGTWYFKSTPYVKKTPEGWLVGGETFQKLLDVVEHVEKATKEQTPRTTSYHFSSAAYKVIIEDILQGLRDGTLYAKESEMGIRIMKPRRFRKDRCVAQIHDDGDLYVCLPGKPITISVPKFVYREIVESKVKREKEQVLPRDLEIWKRMIK